MTQYNPFEEFEQSFRESLDSLTSQGGDDEALSALEYLENAVEGGDLASYVPEWLSPYVSIAGHVMLEDMGLVTGDPDAEGLDKFMTALVPAVTHAVRLGYVDGYLDGYKDGLEEARGAGE